MNNKGIICPKCESDNTGVIDSRAAANNTIRRRRHCFDCSFRFTTYEACLNFGVQETIEKLRKHQKHLNKVIKKFQGETNALCKQAVATTVVKTDTQVPGNTNL